MNNNDPKVMCDVSTTNAELLISQLHRNEWDRRHYYLSENGQTVLQYNADIQFPVIDFGSLYCRISSRLCFWSNQFWRHRTHMHLHGNLKIKQEQFRTKTKHIIAMFFSDFITYVHCNVLKEQDVLCEVFFQRDF